MRPFSDGASPPPRLVDLARHLGLSKSTVSLALRNIGRVSPKTRARVQAAAEELGYRPDPVMSAFSRHRAKRVLDGSVMAIIVNGDAGGQRMILERAVQPLGYLLETFDLRQYPSQQALARVLRARGVAGVVFPEMADPVALDRDIWEAFGGVYCGPYPGDEGGCPFDIVRYNPFNALILAWEKAMASGYRRIALVMPTHHSELTSIESKVVAAYEFIQRRRRGTARLTPLVYRFQQRNTAQPRDWLSKQHPDVVIGAVTAARSILLQSEVRIPQDVAFISLRARPHDPLVAGCLTNMDAILEIAVRHLHSLIQHPEDRPQPYSTSLVINPQWKPGASFPE